MTSPLPQPTPAPTPDVNNTDPANIENPAENAKGRPEQLDTEDRLTTYQPPQPLNQGKLFNTDKGISG